LIPSVLGPPASATARGGPSFEPAREPIFDRSLPYVPPWHRTRETRRSGGRPRNGRNAWNRGTCRSGVNYGRRGTSPSPSPSLASSHNPAIRWSSRQLRALGNRSLDRRCSRAGNPAPTWQCSAAIRAAQSGVGARRLCSMMSPVVRKWSLRRPPRARPIPKWRRVSRLLKGSGGGSLSLATAWRGPGVVFEEWYGKYCFAWSATPLRGRIADVGWRAHIMPTPTWSHARMGSWIFCRLELVRLGGGVGWGGLGSQGGPVPVSSQPS